MRRRIDLNPDASLVVISGRVLNELCAHALDALPEECCGLVTGKDDDRFRCVHRCRNDMTLLHRNDPHGYPRTGAEAYHMSEVDYLAAQREAETQGDVVTAVYHSHVGAGVYFSELDQEFAQHAFFPFPDAGHIVLAVYDARVAQVGLFERSSAGGGFVGRPVKPGAP